MLEGKPTHPSAAFAPGLIPPVRRNKGLISYFVESKETCYYWFLDFEYGLQVDFSEDYSRILDSFEERSQKVLNDLVLRISTIVRQEQSTLTRTIYFHNFSRFDGIILLKHLACHYKSYKLKALMRNNRLYELAVYSGKKMLFRFRDSLNLLPGKLSDLAKNLWPGLGPKGSIPYEEVRLSNLASMKESLLDYMKQDILLLGGVMQKAQEIYWKLYKVDIESKITLSSLALTIFRKKFYDPKTFPIHIPSKSGARHLHSSWLLWGAFWCV